MEVAVDKKKIKSIKNAEKRKERSKVAARCRRGKECEIFNDISECLPIAENSKSGLDKASVMRLAICDLKLKRMMETIFLKTEDSSSSVINEEFESLINLAIGGFVLVLNLEGDVIYASEGISTHLGTPQYDIMGQSIYGFTSESDHHDIKSMLAVKKGEDDTINNQRFCLFKMKNSVTGRGRNAHLRSGNFKVINCIGRIFTGNETDANNQWFVSVCEPLLHPSDVDIPLNKQTFLSKHTPDMKFEYVDESVSAFMGYSPDEMIGKSLFEFHHAADGEGIAKSFKSLYEKTQNVTDRYRFLTKGGGWVWIITQATVIPSENHCKTPNSVVCIHFITSGREEEKVILSEVQLSQNIPVLTLIPPAPVPGVIPFPKNVLSEKKANVVPLIPTVPLVKPDFFSMYTADENEFIAELISGPLLNNATCSTAKIFAPRTEDMDTGFLMPVDDTLIVSKDEPIDLTHLAPIAGDECVTLDAPLLEDLLATLDEADMSYSFMDSDSDEIPRFELSQHIPPMNQTFIKQEGISSMVNKEQFKSNYFSITPSPLLLHSSTDPTMLHSPGSPYPYPDSPTSSKNNSNSNMLSPPAPLNQMEDPLFSERLIGKTPSPGPFSIDSPCSGPNFNCTIPSLRASPPPLQYNVSLNDQFSRNNHHCIGNKIETLVKTNLIPWTPEEKIKEQERLKSPLFTDPSRKDQIFSCSPVVDQMVIPEVGNQSELDNGDQCWMFTDGTELLNINEKNINLDQVQPTSNKLSKMIPLTSNSIREKFGGNQERPIVIFVPVIFSGKRKGSMSSNQSTNSGSDSDAGGLTSRFEVQNDEQALKNTGFNQLLHNYALEQVNQHNGMFLNSVDYPKRRTDVCPKRVRKRNFAGSLLGDCPISLHELTRQDCEVNAPINQTELLQGPEILVALDTGAAVTNEAMI